MSLDAFLRGTERPRTAVSNAVVEAVIKSTRYVTKHERRPDVAVAVVQVVRGGAAAETLCCLASELPALEETLSGEEALESWVVEHRTVNVDDIDVEGV